MRLSICKILVLPAAGLFVGKVAAAEPVTEESFTGKTVTIDVGFAAGGAAATEAAVVAERLGDFIPGHPKVIVNYRPGGGGRIANNYFYNIARPNGLEIGRLDNSVAVANLLADSSIKYISTKFEWLGSFVPDGWALFLRPQAGVSSFDALTKSGKPLRIGSISSVHKTYSNARLLETVFGVKFEMITGYPSGKDIELAAERGEVDGSVAAYDGFMQRGLGEFRRGELNVVLQSGIGEDHRPIPGLETVPTISSLAPAKFLPLIRVTTLPWDAPFAAPPDTPPGIIRQLRSSLQDLSRDAAFRLAYRKATGMDVSFTPGEQVKADVETISQSPADVAQELQALYRQ